MKIHLKNDVAGDTKLIGWIDANIKEIKGEFYLVEYGYQNKHYSKILTRNLIRHKLTDDDISVLHIEDYICYDMDFLHDIQNKNEKIRHLSENIKKLVTQTKFVFYSNSSNKLFIFCKTIQRINNKSLLDLIINTAKEHYVCKLFFNHN